MHEAMTEPSASAETGSAPEMVLVHGTGGTAQSHFGALVPLLPRGYRILATDLTWDGLDQHAQDVVAALGERVMITVPRERSGDRILVGYSLGAVVAASLASRHPHAFTHLVLIAGWSATGPYQRLRQDLQLRLAARDERALRQFTTLMALGPSFLSTRSATDMEDLIATIEIGPDPVAQAYVNRAIDISAELERIRLPTLIIAGTEDAMVPAERTRQLQKAIVGSELREVHAGHAILHEAPRQVADAIREFCSR